MAAARVGEPTARRMVALIALDAASVVLLLALGLSEMREAGDDIFFRSVDGWGVALLAAATVPAIARRLAPVAATSSCTLAQAVVLVAGYAPTNAVLAIPFCLYSVGCQRSRRLTVTLTVASLLVLIPPAFDAETGSVQFLLLSIVIFGAAALAGDGAKARRLYAETVVREAEQAEAKRELDKREAIVAERARLARELHDAVGHTVNVLVLHAGAGRVSAANDAARATEVLGEIEVIGRAALADVDRLLGLLRDDEDATASRQPAVGVGDIPALVERLGTTGLDVRLDLVGSGPVPATVGAAAYRITQEALTNAVKHAGPATVDVRIEVGETDVSVLIEDDGRGAGVVPDPARVGRGVIGMRERVSLLGGTLAVGPRPGGGFRVQAVLPFAPGPGRSDISPSDERTGA